MKFSIITPTYNSAKYVKDTIISVDKQTYKNVEHIIIDGCSTDNTVDIINSFTSNRIRLLVQPDDGMYDAINTGLSLATGDVIVFLNSDDQFVDANVLEKVADIFINHSASLELALVGDVVFYYQKSRNKSVRRVDSTEVSELIAFGNCTFIPQPALFVAKTIVDKVGNFDCTFKIASDYDYIIRIFEFAKCRPLGFTTTIFRRHEDSLTESQSISMRNDSMAIQKKFILRYKLGFLKLKWYFFTGALKYVSRNPVVLLNKAKKLFHV